MEKVYNALEEVIQSITNSKDYKICMELKKQMKSNEEINSLIKKIKETQKKYIKSNYDEKWKEELDTLEEKLFSIPIYNEYNHHLEKVNEKINYVRDSLNDYFYKLLNE